MSSVNVERGLILLVDFLVGLSVEDLSTVYRGPRPDVEGDLRAAILHSGFKSRPAMVPDTDHSDGS